MDEFDYLDAQFRRLAEARALRIQDEAAEAKHRPAGWHSAFETAEQMIANSIRDYLKLRQPA